MLVFYIVCVLRYLELLFHRSSWICLFQPAKIFANNAMKKGSSKYDSRIIEWVVGSFVVQCGKGRNPFSFTINRWWIRYREDFLGILWMFSICSR